MLQHEFESRVGITVSANEYAAIEQVYMNSDVEKDEFCKLWARMNRQRIAHIKAEHKTAAQFKALPIEEQVIVKMLELAQQRSNETGSTLPVSDTQIDASKVRARYDEADGFTVYLVLRDTGAAIEHTYTAAKQEAKDFSSSNPTIYAFFGNRSLNYGYYKLGIRPESTKHTF